MERNQYKMLVFCKDDDDVKREMFLDVRRIIAIDKWDDKSDKQGFAIAYLDGSDDCRILLESYHELLGKWLSV